MIDDAVAQFFAVVAAGAIPVAIPSRTADDQCGTLAVVAFANEGRVAATLAHPDPVVRARLLVGLTALARDRARGQLDAGGVPPA